MAFRSLLSLTMHRHLSSPSSILCRLSSSPSPSQRFTPRQLIAFWTVPKRFSTDTEGPSAAAAEEEEAAVPPPRGPSTRDRSNAQNVSTEVLLPGCDFKHWLIFMEPPKEGTLRDEIIDRYVKTLAEVVGSEEEAKVKIYSVSTRHYYAFGALISQEVSNKLKSFPGVHWVLPDSYLHPKTKDYGGEPFINGKAVPYDPKYHSVWLQNNKRQPERGSRHSDRPPRNFDQPRERPPRNFDHPKGRPFRTYDQPRDRPPQNFDQPRDRPPQNFDQPKDTPPQNFDQPRDKPPQNFDQPKDTPPQNFDQPRDTTNAEP